ncbi:WecB/TagA/CpsF family glycosyltransferase [Shewanella algae]|jgi:UDP-N-acetyl-D-mannosaminouronate:lipid I N-acetyl-D-mannosaminouronosyltransferase|uniref:WecB/TagA/CpsF family glycosyltransferase n=1 Tax=Shewanella algae TaxID=38313 RepID=UPI0030071CC6
MKQVSICDYRVLAPHSVSEFAEYIINNKLGSFSSAIAVNPEKIVTSLENDSLRSTLLNADILYPDGIGVSSYMSRKLKHKVARVPGCELWEQLMLLAGERQLPVFLLGGTEQVVQQTKAKLISDFSTPIVGYMNGFYSDEDSIIEMIRVSRPSIVSVALGSPKQEIFIKKCKEFGLDCFFIGVGGTYDVFSGNMQRAPLFFRNLGLEWFYRLVKQPSRIFRQFKLIKFILLVLRGRL